MAGAVPVETEPGLEKGQQHWSRGSGLGPPCLGPSALWPRLASVLGRGPKWTLLPLPQLGQWGACNCPAPCALPDSLPTPFSPRLPPDSVCRRGLSLNCPGCRSYRRHPVTVTHTVTGQPSSQQDSSGVLHATQPYSPPPSAMGTSGFCFDVVTEVWGCLSRPTESTLSRALHDPIEPHSRCFPGRKLTQKEGQPVPSRKSGRSPSKSPGCPLGIWG